MSAGAIFDAKAAKKLEAIYRTPDVVEQRRATLAALALAPGERVLDIGCGPGLLLAEMAAAVGPAGRADGIDTSAEMVAAAGARCADLPWVGVEAGDAAALPYPDAGFDAAAAVQVYLYLCDLPRALGELRRVLKPGGRALVLDTDWDSAVWHSRDRTRMARVLAAWEEHFHDAHLAIRLAPALRRAGFAIERQSVLPLLNAGYDEASYSASMLRVIRAFVTGRRGITREEAGAWADELRERAREGEYFFSLNRYLFLARKPG
jgi:ubiquinone/menaquinone biosynthesis C-methylase UbiE